MTTTRRLRVAAQPEAVRNIKVMFLIDSLGPGGAERLLIDLLPRLRQHGVESEVVAIQDRHGNPVAEELRAVGFPVSTIGIERLRERGAIGRVMAAVERSAPDVIHTQLEFADVLGSIAGNRLGIPSIATIHTLDRPRRWSKEAAHFRLMAWTLRRRSHRVIAVSESARRHVLSKAGLRKRHTVTIHNGIDLTPYTSADGTSRSTVRRQMGIPPEAPVITTVAVLRRPKGIDYMLEALPSVLASHPDLRYVIVGDGPHRTYLEARTKELEIDRAVHFAGHRTDVPDVLAAADVFVLPSLAEALPTVIIEAMAGGLPTVATTVGGIPEIVDQGITGVLVPPADSARLADAVGRLLDSPRQRHAMGIAGRRAATDKFSIERHASRLVAEYRILVSRAEDA